MKRIVLGTSVAALLLLGACGEVDNEREVKSGQEEGSAEQEQEKEVVEQDKKEKAVGVRSNPLPFGDTITVKGNIYDDAYNSHEASLEITLLETIRGEAAWTIIQNENQFNDPAKEGFEYVLIRVKGFLKEAETDDDSLLFSSWDFDFVSNEGEVYDSVSAVIPDELHKELYNGATGEGYIYGQVRIDDAFRVSYDSSEGSPVFFFVE